MRDYTKIVNVNDIKTAMELLKLFIPVTNIELGRFMGVSKQAISAIFNGNTNLNNQHMISFLVYLDYKVKHIDDKTKLVSFEAAYKAIYDNTHEEPFVSFKHILDKIISIYLS